MDSNVHRVFLRSFQDRPMAPHARCCHGCRATKLERNDTNGHGMSTRTFKHCTTSHSSPQNTTRHTRAVASQTQLLQQNSTPSSCSRESFQLSKFSRTCNHC